jgi:histidinol-phosphate aminotransferase
MSVIPSLQVIREDIQALSAYAVQDAQGFIKLDAMENPYVLEPAMRQALGERLSQVHVNRYPGTRVQDLKRALMAHAQVPSGMELMLGNGSDELIGLLDLACAKPGACVLAPEPGFVMYAMSAKLLGLKYVGVDLTPDFGLDVPAMQQAIERHRPAIVYLAYPNNPSANLWSPSDIEAIIAQVSAYQGVVVMDEAYQPFSSDTWLNRMREDPQNNAQVLLMRTLSKFGLAGARLGYLVGAKEWIQTLEKVRPPYNVSVLNAECALFALEHEAVFKAQAQEIVAERTRLSHALSQDLGLSVYASSANMLLMRLQPQVWAPVAALPPSDPELSHKLAAHVFKGLKDHGVLIKNVSTMHPLLRGCLRVTVGTQSENTALLAALKALLHPNSVAGSQR